MIVGSGAEDSDESDDGADERFSRDDADAPAEERR